MQRMRYPMFERSESVGDPVSVDTMMSVYNPQAATVPMSEPSSYMVPPVNKAGLITESILGPTPPPLGVPGAQVPNSTVPVADVPAPRRNIGRKRRFQYRGPGYQMEA